jgi:hypothetical protein
MLKLINQSLTANLIQCNRKPQKQTTKERCLPAVYLKLVSSTVLEIKLSAFMVLILAIYYSRLI